VTVQLLASDKETPDELTFSFGDGAPEGATIDAKTGLISWTPASTSQPGDVEIPIKVTDEGTPQQTTSVTLVIKVQDDAAQFTFLTAFVSTEADRQAWLYDRSTNKRIVLRKGGTLNYGGFNALVIAIGREFVDVQQNGETWRIDVGKSLRQARMIAKAEPKKVVEPKPEPPPEPETKDQPDTKTAQNDADEATSGNDAGTSNESVDEKSSDEKSSDAKDTDAKDE
jgi:hypothetical protein